MESGTRSPAGPGTPDGGADAAAPPPALPTFAADVCPQLPLAELDAGTPDLTRLQVQLLANRGYRGAAARGLLAADWRAAPPDPLGLDRAVARLCAAARAGERVVVCGDYDADGLTACAVMLLALRRAGVAAEPYLPVRADAGRGLNEAAVRRLAAEGARLLVTTDCGTGNVAEVRLAAALGMEVLVTDHHPPQGELPPALAIVNPRQPGCPCAAACPAGAGVALWVAEALLAALGDAGRAEALEGLLDLAAIGTIGDVAPLTRENWALTRAGLRRLNGRPRPGLRALVERAGLRPGALTERDVSFALAPRLNAAGRMGDPRVALELLLTEDAAEAARLASELQRLNEERQRATDAVLAVAWAQAQAQLAEGDPGVLLTRGEGWPTGVLGLVAARLAEDMGRPALAVSVDGEACRGSARGPAGFNLVAALAERADLLRYFGGHERAAGFTLATADLPALAAHLRAAAGGSAQGPGGPAPAALRVDCHLPLRRAGADTYAAVRALAPYGPGFAPPVFLASRVRVLRAWRSGPEGRTLRLALREGAVERRALWSRHGGLLPALRAPTLVDVAYTLDVEPRGETDEHVLRLVGLRPAEGGAYPPT
jgi:single-stranded-DNA-specific exonuclease